MSIIELVSLLEFGFVGWVLPYLSLRLYLMKSKRIKHIRRLTMSLSHVLVGISCYYAWIAYENPYLTGGAYIEYGGYLYDLLIHSSPIDSVSPINASIYAHHCIAFVFRFAMISSNGIMCINLDKYNGRSLLFVRE